ncbi:MAG TPA: hypothetical protein VLX31_06495 [Streptosporangiaceae bacterium]|nr:hypothetical protein [Streptosporangiaceae bacterium]
MLASVKAKLGAVVAVAAIATSGAMAVSGVADAATTHPAARLFTALSIKAAVPVTRHGRTFDVIAGQLTSSGTPLRFKLIWLERQGPKGHWFIVQRERTRLHGWVAYRVRERQTTNFRLVFPGSPNFRPAVSTPVTITAGS